MTGRFLFLSLLISAGLWIAWPYHAAWSLAEAIARSDSEAVERGVAWERLRQGLKDDVNARMARNGLSDSKETSGLGIVGAALGGLLVERIIDQWVTPSTLGMVLANASKGKTAKDHARKAKEVRENLRKNVSYAFFTSPTEFLVEFKSQGKGEPPLRVLFTFTDWRWKLARLYLPSEDLTLEDLAPTPATGG